MSNLGRGSLIISLGLFWQQAAVFLLGVVIARSLGPEAFGVHSILKNLSLALLFLTPLGLDLALLKHVRLLGGRSQEFELVYALCRVVVVGLNLLAVAVMFLWIGPLLESQVFMFPAFSMLLVVTLIGGIFAADLQLSSAVHRATELHVRYAVITNYGQPALRLLLTIVAIALGLGLPGVVWAGVAALALNVLVLEGMGRFPMQRLRLDATALKDAWRRATTILREAVWMAFSLLLYGVMRFLDVLVVGNLVSVKAAGEYAALSSIAQVIQIYPTAMSQTLGAEIATMYAAGDVGAIRDVLRRYVRLAALVAGYLAAGVAVFGTQLDLLFGPEFQFTSTLSVLLAVGWFVSGVLSPLGYALSMTGRHRTETLILGGSVVVTVLLLIYLTTVFGAAGAALAVAVGFGITNFARCLAVRGVLGGLPLQFANLLPLLVFLSIGYGVRAVASTIERSLPLLVLECCIFTVLCAGAAFLLFANSEQRTRLTTALARRWRT
jgi:O-antigen/teichoic acid export membrane protein